MYQHAIGNWVNRSDIVDLRSDTVTKPSDGMRQAMAAAGVGDDVYGEDPTTLELEERVAALTGKDAGLFVPSGTQSNLIALLAHCGQGGEFIVGNDYHSYLYESGGAAAVGGISPCPVPTDENGSLLPSQIQAAIKPDFTWYARTKLLALENTVAGQVQSLERTKTLCDVADENDLSTHLDGARIWHAAVELNVSVGEVAAPFDSVSTCLSKGLGAPVGSVLCGSKAFITEAARIRKMVGGGMRQAGILAAAGLYALDHNIELLRVDHRRAKHLASRLSNISELEVRSGDTNMLFVEPQNSDIGALVDYLVDAGIVIGPPTSEFRLVTHLDISDSDIDRVVEKFQEFYKTR